MINAKNSKAFIIYLALSLIMACSTSPKQVRELARGSLYDQAIENYNRLSKKEKKVLDITIIRNQRLEYEQALISDIDYLVEKQAFTDAQKKIDEGMRNIPSSKQLINANAKFVKQKEKYTKKYQAKYDIEYARYLIKEKEILEQLKKVKSNEKGFNSLYKSRSKDYLIYSEIIGQQSLEAIEKKQPSPVVRELLAIAQQLNEKDRWQDELDTIVKQELSDQAKEEQETKQKKQYQRQLIREKIKWLKVKFDTDFKKGDLLTSKSHLKKIKMLDTTDIKWLQNAQKNLDKAINKELEEALKKGEDSYSKGDIAISIKIWKRALVFSPDDKRLNENILRAERFQEKFDELNQSR